MTENIYRVTAKQRMTVAERAEFCCEYCGSQEKYSPQPFSVEHIMPRVRGGLTELSNLAFACQGCNGHKSAKVECIDPLSGEAVPLFNPRTDLWKKNFAWNDDFIKVIGLSATGRATIEALQLNRWGLSNLRQVLHILGKHPPDRFGGVDRLN